VTKSSQKQIERVRRICTALPDVTEKVSHGEPTWFADNRVFCGFSNNHHNDGHVAVCIPVPPGVQADLLKESPKTYYYPPYVGVKGWIGIELAEIGDDELGAHLAEAWKLISKPARKTRALRG
jgi:hypothetical protein